MAEPRPPIPLPAKLGRLAFHEAGLYCAIGWLGHCAGLPVPEGPGEWTVSNGNDFLENVATHYGLEVEDVESLMCLNDSTPAHHRVYVFHRFCVRHQLPVVEAV